MISRITELHNTVFSAIERATDGWFLGLFARFSFLAVLFFYYLNSAGLKVEDGFFGFFTPSFGAYIQILTEQGLIPYDFDAANVPWYLDIVVYAGTYSEFILPILIVIGLFSRIAALGMIGFIFVQSFVDINFHGADESTVGAWFDRDSASLIMDQRLLWVFLLSVIVVKGAGLVSVDGIVQRIRGN